MIIYAHILRVYEDYVCLWENIQIFYLYFTLTLKFGLDIDYSIEIFFILFDTILHIYNGLVSRTLQIL